jgi:uncharacterized protein YegJ (DUF2314 family)
MANDNINYYCQEHAPKPIPYEGAMQDLVGKWVKVRFSDPATLADRIAAEHMWVKVESVADDTASGYLDSEPRHVTNIRLHDKVTVNRKDIEDIYAD